MRVIKNPDALLELESLLSDFLIEYADRFEEDEPIEGADLVQWWAEHYEDLKACLCACRDNGGPWHVEKESCQS